MTYKVSLSSPYNFSVKSSQPSNYKTSFSYSVEIMPQNLNDLTDVEISSNNDKYVLMYDASTNKWRDVNPDSVVSAASTEPIQPGLPVDFVNTLDVDLDNKIDLDAGTF
jgi:hypothetical protein